MSARRDVLEKLLVEATGNSPRKADKGSVRLNGPFGITWSERGLGRSCNVDWDRFWDLVDEALSA